MPKVDDVPAAAAVPARRGAPRHNVVPDLAGRAVPISSLRPDPRNARVHGDDNLAAIQASLAAYGQVKPVVVRRATGVVLAGNGTLAAAKALGWTHLAATFVDLDETAAAAYGIADNRTAELAQWDFATLREIEAECRALGHPVPGFAPGEVDDLILSMRTDDFVAPPGADDQPRVSLAERFLVPPFSVLDARQGYWQARKRAWLALGIKSELGRGDDLLSQAQGVTDANAIVLAACKRAGRAAPTTGGNGKKLGVTYGSGAPGDLAAGFKAGGKGARAIPGGGTGKNSAYLFKQADGGYKPLKELQAAEAERGLCYGVNQRVRDTLPDQTGLNAGQSGTSIFDPVLCELAYRWFSAADAAVLDPFAGGSVRGVVAAKLGRRYAGVELNPLQVLANREQADSICPDNAPRWVEGDALDVARLAPGKYDLLFSCPPYASLEVYSDDPRDISTMPYTDFLTTYTTIIGEAAKLLKPDRFAVWVVGHVRDPKTGAYRDFVGDTVGAFATAGLALYNDAVLVTSVGSLPIRVGRQFVASRKLGSTHQNVLVFVKGDAKKAVAAAGPCECPTVEEMLGRDAEAIVAGGLENGEG